MTASVIWVRACRLTAFETRVIVAVSLADRQLILVRHDGQVFALDRTCPHEQADLAQGWCADGKLFCPRHRAWFDLGDGSVSLGWSFPPLKTYAVRVTETEVLVRL